MKIENQHMLKICDMSSQDREAAIAQAMEALVMLDRYALGLAKSRELADVVLQEAGVKVCRYIGSFQDGTNMVGWVATIVKNTFLNLINRENLEKKLFCHHVDGYGGERDVSYNFREQEFYRFHEVGGLDQFVLHHLSDQMVQSLNGLSQVNRDVVILVDLLDLSYQDAADVLGVPIGTIMSRLFRARSVLKRELAELAESYGIYNSSES